MADRSPSYDPDVEDIEERAAIFDPDWEDAEDDDDDDDMDYAPAAEELSGSEQEAFEDAEENILSALLENGDVEIEIQDEEDEDEDNEDEEEEEDNEEEEQTTGGGARPVFGTSMDRLTCVDLINQSSHTRSATTYSPSAWSTAITSSACRRSISLRC